jgi:hypothetical protein
MGMGPKGDHHAMVINTNGVQLFTIEALRIESVLQPKARPR